MLLSFVILAFLGSMFALRGIVKFLVSCDTNTDDKEKETPVARSALWRSFFSANLSEK
jgi:hypothetical protein